MFRLMLNRSLAYAKLTKAAANPTKPITKITPFKAKRRLRKFLGSAFLAGVGLMVYSSEFNNKIKLTYEPTPKNKFIINSSKTLTEEYRGTFYLPFGILEGLFSARIESSPQINTIEDKILLKDGDHLDIEWTELDTTSDENNKIAIFLGCINGSPSNSTYVKHTLQGLHRGGFRGVLCHYRHHKLEPDYPKPKGFMSYGDMTDINALVDHVHQKYPQASIYLVGLFMGGNMWYRWLPENKDREYIKALFTVGAPFSVQDSMKKLSSIQHRVEAMAIAPALIDFAEVYRDLCKEKGIDIDWDRVKKCTTPECVGRNFRYPVYIQTRGIEKSELSFEEYIARSDATNLIPKISIPTMILNTRNDPTLDVRTIPWKELRSNSNVIHVLGDRGYHIEYMTGNDRERWYKRVMTDFFNGVHNFDHLSSVEIRGEL